MSLQLPVKKRRQILAAAVLLKVEAEGMQLSAFTKSLMVGFLTLLYCMFIGGSVYNIVNKRLPNIDTFIEVFAAASVMATALYISAILLIIKSKRAPLIFTEAGIAGTALFSARYEDLRGYGWESCRITRGAGA